MGIITSSKSYKKKIEKENLIANLKSKKRSSTLNDKETMATKCKEKNNKKRSMRDALNNADEEMKVSPMKKQKVAKEGSASTDTSALRDFEETWGCTPKKKKPLISKNVKPIF